MEDSRRQSGCLEISCHMIEFNVKPGDVMEDSFTIHAENQYMFEILRANLLSNDVKDAITFDDYDKEYKRIIKSLERYSYCSDCSYKNRFEKMKNIIKEKDEKSE